MSRKLRYIPEGGALVEVTCRTLQGRFLLRPSWALNEIVLGVLGRAQRLNPVRICAFTFLSTHFHLLLEVDDAQQLAKLGHLNSNLAREVGRLTGWREKVWPRRYQAIIVSTEEAAQIDRLRYVLAHGVKEDLVPRPPTGSSIALALDLALRWKQINDDHLGRA
jgi:REP element-mobilizing transposase RayT